MSRVLWKDGVKFDLVAPAGFKILSVLKQIAETFPKDLTITAGTDGKHAKTSKHYRGEAADCRAKDQTPDEQQLFLALLDKYLGPKKFYYFLEGKGTPNIHWHIQKRSGVVYTWMDFLE